MIDLCAKKVATKQSDGLSDSVRVYVGPTLHRRALVMGNSYRGGLSEYVEGLVSKIPELDRMIVPMAEVSGTRRRLKEPGTEENRLYQYLETIRFDENGEVRK